MTSNHALYQTKHYTLKLIDNLLLHALIKVHMRTVTLYCPVRP